MIKSAPLREKSLNNVTEEKLENYQICDFLDILLSEHEEQWKLNGLKEYLKRECYEPWPQLEWFSKYFIPDLLNCIAKVPISCEDIVLKFGTVFQRISFFLGSGFVQFNLIPAFKNALPLLDTTPDTTVFDECWQAKKDDEFFYTQSGLLPTYYLGVLDRCSPNYQVCLVFSANEMVKIYQGNERH